MYIDLHRIVHYHWTTAMVAATTTAAIKKSKVIKAFHGWCCANRTCTLRKWHKLFQSMKLCQLHLNKVTVGCGRWCTWTYFNRFDTYFLLLLVFALLFANDTDCFRWNLSFTFSWVKWKEENFNKKIIFISLFLFFFNTKKIFEINRFIQLEGWFPSKTQI